MSACDSLPLLFYGADSGVGVFEVIARPCVESLNRLVSTGHTRITGTVNGETAFMVVGGTPYRVYFRLNGVMYCAETPGGGPNLALVAASRQPKGLV